MGSGQCGPRGETPSVFLPGTPSQSLMQTELWRPVLNHSVVRPGVLDSRGPAAQRDLRWGGLLPDTTKGACWEFLAGQPQGGSVNHFVMQEGVHFSRVLLVLASWSIRT
jgi:hypothetical protein